MNVLPLINVLGTIIAASITPALAYYRKSKDLLEVDNNTTTYTLNEEVLQEISRLQQPIRVIAGIGNARVGKSTTLNLISHICDQRSKGDHMEEIFETGDSVRSQSLAMCGHT